LWFGFGGPFSGSGVPERFGIIGPSGIEFGIGTHGGGFEFHNDGTFHECNNDIATHTGLCGAAVSIQANIGMVSDTGLSLGDVASIEGPGTAQGFFCWGAACAGHDPTSFPPVFDLEGVRATYEFTLTDPGTPEPFTWTGAQFSFGAAPVPEPATGIFAILGLAGLAAGVLGIARRAEVYRNRSETAKKM
jgi:hypothetical protein